MKNKTDIAEVIEPNLNFSSTKSLKTTVYMALRKTILSGEIPVGTRINESMISARFNISRTPLRGALQSLRDENLLEYVPDSGMIVKGITIRDAYEIFTIRKSLDRLATITAMYKMSEADFKELDLIVYLMQQQDKVGGNLTSLFTEFNEFIYEKSHLLRLRDTIANIQNYLSYFRELSVHSKDRSKGAIEDHAKIYYYMKRKDEKQVGILLDTHLDNALNSILNEMDKK
ncbi:GntR family transcriptional regulator [Enterococcus caccae]|uniref:HTH gntR-type domain-containing protein n=1 Tax=Enterococcus caccae ATCC BAA-1240 TaxID=1158612 RepID=R3TPZ9_9ENTE|nr:GntR family transcriptional regulator [Enterococcus caccae]EOL43614.1 hypothetical protein UC7_02944 [Enterococcus caccae ATCC BAA-1240]EOT67986.1 hypothetical protein I580_00368 [Enterococcus caccae ATCC BAA-1240]OJG28525.1 hypothetical protein RU98_GL000118 [Enterococcus caccae]